MCTNYISPPLLPLESDFDLESVTKWWTENWTKSLHFSLAYILLICALEKCMRKKTAFSLRPLLTAWNVCLASFSIMGAVRMYPEFLNCVSHGGFRSSVCENGYARGVPAFWACLFCLSKVLELGDTVFVVLRKQKLTFLHCFHHITVLLYAWYSFPEHPASARWFTVMNYTIHALMYTYYALRSARVPVSRKISMAITCGQLGQMVLGCYISVYSMALKSAGQNCKDSYNNLIFSLLMYLSYFVLFSHFFYNTYCASSKVVEKTKVNCVTNNVRNDNCKKVD